MKIKTFAITTILFLVMGSTVCAQNNEYTLSFYPLPSDTIYLLPQQSLWCNVSVFQNDFNYNIGAIQLNVTCWNDDGVTDDPQYIWNHPDYKFSGYDLFLDATYYLNYENNRWIYKALLSNTLLAYFNVATMSYFNQTYPTNPFTSWYDVTIINGDLREHYISTHQTFINIDGYLGDVSGDKIVNYDDLELLISHEPGKYSEGYYTQNGLNYSRGSILFRSYVSLLDIYILNLWLSNPTNPIIANLGIGQLMSDVQSPTLASVNASIVGGELIITTEGNAVSVSTFLPDGTLWQNAAWVNNGQIAMAIPDPNLEYQIEAVQTNTALAVEAEQYSTPNKYQLNQNYPNPFNPSTTISYSLPMTGHIDLNIYSLTGQTVMTLVNDVQTAGDHSVEVNFGQENLPSGIYFYRLTTPTFQSTRKLIYVK